MEIHKTRTRGIITTMILLISLFQTCPVMAVELLIQAKPHWQDSWDENKVSGLSKEEIQAYEARTQVGDIIVVRPDGWEWGKEEGLPNYIVVKIPDVSFEEAKKYEEVLKDETGKVLKKRKYMVPQMVVNGWKFAGKSDVTIGSLDEENFTSDVIEKTE